MWQILELVTHRGETPLIKRDLGTSQWFFSKLVTNCKGPHTINTANVGSTRDLISQKEMYKGKEEESFISGGRCATPAPSP